MANAQMCTIDLVNMLKERKQTQSGSALGFRLSLDLKHLEIKKKETKEVLKS